MLRLTKTKMVAMLLIATTLVMFNGVSAFAEQKPLAVGSKSVYISSNAYQYYADASTSGAEPNSGISCTITNSHYIAVHKDTGVVYQEDKGPVTQVNSVSVSFYAPTDYKTSSISTVHSAYYIGYTNSGNTADSY